MTEHIVYFVNFFKVKKEYKNIVKIDYYSATQNVLNI